VNKRLAFLFCLSSIAIGLDQLTKLYVHTNFQLHEVQEVFKNFFNITYVRNYGAAFGFLSHTPEQFRQIFFLMMPPLACGIIIWILSTVKETQTWQIIALSSIFGGAVGNYIDRLHYGYVVDFLDFHIYNKYSWPAFNFADTFIVCGVIYLIYLILTEKEISH
jgi:signal peptidase II